MGEFDLQPEVQMFEATEMPYDVRDVIAERTADDDLSAKLDARTPELFLDEGEAASFDAMLRELIDPGPETKDAWGDGPGDELDAATLSAFRDGLDLGSLVSLYRGAWRRCYPDAAPLPVGTLR